MQNAAIKTRQMLAPNGQEIAAMSTTRRQASIYVRRTLGPEYSIHSGVAVHSGWRFLIQRESPTVDRPVIVGRVDVVVDATPERNVIIPLDAHDIQTIRERAEILMSDLRGELPLDGNGYIVPQLAVRNVKAYLAERISLFVQPAEKPMWRGDPPPHWQVSTSLQLPNTTTIPLDPISVNAQTGTVVPLTDKQLHALQRRITDATAHPAQSATAAI